MSHAKRTTLFILVILVVALCAATRLAAQSQQGKSVNPFAQFKVAKFSIAEAAWHYYCDVYTDSRLGFEIVPDSADSVLVGASIKMDVRGDEGGVVVYFPDVGDVVYPTPDYGVWPDPYYIPNWVAEAHWGASEDWIHGEYHNFGRSVSPYDSQSLIRWTALNEGSPHVAGLSRYPVWVEFVCPAMCEESPTVEIRDFELSVYYLDNAAEQ